MMYESISFGPATNLNNLRSAQTAATAHMAPVRVVRPFRIYSSAMTLHVYGTIDGTIVSMSDSRTSYSNRPPTDTTNKIVTFPLNPEEWHPGAFSAIVLVQGRASFTPQDDDHKTIGHLGSSSAEEVVRNAIATLLQGETHSGMTTQAFGDAIWSEIRRRMYDCAACRKEVETFVDEMEMFAEEFGESYDHDDAEVDCGNHGSTAFELHIVTIGDQQPDPTRYVRRWGSPNEQHVRPFVDRTFYRSGFLRTNYPEAVPLDNGMSFADESGLQDATEKLFRGTVQILEEQMVADTVGGPIHTLILDPSTGFRRLKTWTL